MDRRSKNYSKLEGSGRQRRSPVLLSALAKNEKRINTKEDTKTVKKMWERFLSLALVSALCASLLCIPALADESAATVTLDRTTVYLAVGDSVQLNATVTGDDQSVTWASLTWDVAQVDDNGVVTAVGEGTTNVRVTAADGTATALCKIIVSLALPSYSLRPGASVTPDTSISGSWTSADPSVATVDGSGKVTGKAFGRTYVTVRSGSRSETFSITVGGHIGIDISSWNNAIDWDALKEQGIEYVMIRAGYGWEHTDKRFEENIKGAIASGMPIGIYFYSYAQDVKKAQVEANYCIKLLEPYRDSITLPVAYDLEEYSGMTGQQLTDVAETFCAAVQNAGYHTMVYANGNFFSKMDLSGLSDMGVDYWYAWYPAVPDLQSTRTLKGSSTQASIWQYSSTAVAQGALASGKTDINVLYMPEYLSFSAPKVTAEYTSGGAQIRWGGSTYAKSYTVYRKSADGDVQTVGTYSGTVHSCTDAKFLPGMGYFVTMDVSDPVDGTRYRSYTGDTVYPAAASFAVKVTAAEGGTAGGGGSFTVGQKAAVTATPAQGYTFAGWYDAAGSKVSSAAEYSFTVTASVTLQARFTKEELPPATATFTDVKDTDWFAEAVYGAVESGLFTGTSDTTFSPRDTMTRGMLVTVLYRQAGTPEASNRNKFVDVSKDAWYAKAVTWAYNNGVVNGTGEKTFSPEAAVTREQMATILKRYSDAMDIEVPETTVGDLSSFADGGEVSSFATEGMRWAVATQLLNGADNRLMPAGKASRAECATILLRWLENGAD